MLKYFGFHFEIRYRTFDILLFVFLTNSLLKAPLSLLQVSADFSQQQ